MYYRIYENDFNMLQTSTEFDRLSLIINIFSDHLDARFFVFKLLKLFYKT